MDVTNRLEKALEVKFTLESLGINEEICPELKEFSKKILGDWIKTGTVYKGFLKLPEIKKKLQYNLVLSKKDTFVKLVEL